MSKLNNVEVIRSALMKDMPLKHPLKEHPLENCDEYIKKLYIDMLCVMAQYENKAPETALNLVQRIMAGIGCNEPVDEHIKRAMQLKYENVKEFLAECKENGLEYIYMYDSLLLAGAGGKPGKKPLEFIAEMMSALGIGEIEAAHISIIAAAILEQNQDKYTEATAKILADDRLKLTECIVCYLKEFVTGIIIDTPDLLWVYSKEKKQFEFPVEIQEDGKERMINSFENHKTCIFENLIIDGGFYLYSGNTAIIRNCDLGFAKFDSFAEVVIDNCLFDGNLGHLNYTFYEVTNNSKIELLNSTFQNYSYCGGLGQHRLRCTMRDKEHYELYNSVRVDKCRFINIHSDNYNGTGERAVFSDSKYDTSISMSNSEFINCKGNYLFYKKPVNFENNTFNNCCSSYCFT